MDKGPYPYFDYILSEIKAHNQFIETSFGHHVHWGYWPTPHQATLDENEFYLAQEALVKSMCEKLTFSEDMSLVDVGCGFGGTIDYLNTHYQSLDLIGLNIDKQQLDRAKARINADNSNCIHFQQGDACALPFQSNSIDNMMAVECIFHFDDRKTFLTEVARTLKPGGQLVLSDFVSSPWILPVASCLALPLWQRISFFGQCKMNITEHAYQKLAKQLGLQLERWDITKNILPTYHFLTHLSRHHTQKSTLKWQGLYFSKVMLLLSRLGLMRYQIIRLSKGT